MNISISEVGHDYEISINENLYGKLEELWSMVCHGITDKNQQNIFYFLIHLLFKF